eukprot:scaffold62164_cov63-Phaeocystis_antarctica.AAC.1
MRSDDDFMTVVAAQNLAVVSGTALLSTSIPTFEMVDTVPRVPFRRSYAAAWISRASTGLCLTRQRTSHFFGRHCG